ncbi:PP2C family protein-serine/threonine phosphatase [Candidatus Hydrogenedentota bacterium]
MSITCHGKTDAGRVRSGNQDSICVQPEDGIFIVSDGIGGIAGGEVASHIVTEVLCEMLRREFPTNDSSNLSDVQERMPGIVRKLNESLRKKAEGTQCDGMGATLISAMVRVPGVLITNLGDSRAYLVRDGILTLLTTDHNLGNSLIEAGEISPEELDSHPAASRLLQYVGMAGQANPDTHILTVREGDLLVLCSDGLTNMVSDKEMLEIIVDADTLEQLCDQMIAAANEAGGRDNISIIAINLPRDDPARIHLSDGREA